MTRLNNQQTFQTTIQKGGNSPFMQFLEKELQQIYSLELKTNQLIRQLLHRTVYQPLKKAMVNYQVVSSGHLSFLRKLGAKNAYVTVENKRTSEQMIRTLTKELDGSSGGENLKDIAMITGIQRIIFYQMAIYRSLCTAARKIYNTQWAESFDEILNDKKENDSIFSEIALSGVYKKAINA